MCDGSIASAGPPIALPMGQTLTQTTPRHDAGGAGQTNQGSGAPAPSANPNLGRHVDLVA